MPIIRTVDFNAVDVAWIYRQSQYVLYPPSFFTSYAVTGVPLVLNLFTRLEKSNDDRLCKGPESGSREASAQ